jgi:(2Fe-2S) ferredoxin
MSQKPARKLKAHIFVCTNERPAEHPRGCCKEKDAEGLVQGFKEELARRGLAGEVRAQRAGCLDTCEFGPSVVIYPDNLWYGPVQRENLGEIVDSLLNGTVVERLRIPGK